MASKKQMRVLLLAASIAVLSCSICAADEIIFENQGPQQIGTVVEESDQNITIVFPKNAIKSIRRSKGEGPIPRSSRGPLEEKGADFAVKGPRGKLEAAPSAVQAAAQSAVQSASQPAVPQPSAGVDDRLEERVDQLEKEVQNLKKAPSATSGTVTFKKLVDEEMGGVEGVILWKGKPIQSAKVMIVMETYTGFSVAALKASLKKMVDKSSGAKPPGEDQISLETQTDSNGHYSFPAVPPGLYTLFWQPSPKIGWVRRLSDKPDFEIVPGQAIIFNIPEKKPKRM